MRCWELPVVCYNKRCRYFTGMTYVGRLKYGNCAIRVANSGPHTLNELSEILGVSRERVRQIEAAALRHLSFNMVKVNEQVLKVVKDTLGEVVWPLRSTKNVEVVKTPHVRLLKLMDDQGALDEFVKKRKLPSNVVGYHVKCPVLKDVVRAVVCLLCDQRGTCRVCPVKNVNPRNYLVVGSFEELVKLLKVKLELSPPRELRDKILAYAKEHPSSPVSHVAVAVGASYVYTRRVLRERR